MAFAGRKGGIIRRKPSRRGNRYNPNEPDYNAVHGGFLRVLNSPAMLMPRRFRMAMAGFSLAGLMPRR